MDMNEQTTKDKSAIIAGLFLGNLTLIPGIGFLILVVWFLKGDDNKTDLERHHLLVAMYGTLSALFLLVVLPLVAILATEIHESMVMAMISYFILTHALIILFATYALSKALNQDYLHKQFGTKSS